MSTLRIIALVTYTFGVYSMGTLLWLSRRERCASRDEREMHLVGNAMLALCCVWFLSGVQLLLVKPSPGWYYTALQVGRLFLGFAFPPMIMHIYLADRSFQNLRHRGEELPVGWRVFVIAAYMLAAVTCTWSMLAIFDVIDMTGQQIGILIGSGIGGGFFTAAVFSLLVIQRTRFQDEPKEVRDSHRGSLGMLRFLAVLAVLILFANVYRWPWGEILQLVGGSLPLLFIFVGTYHEARFQFFDLFVKRGLNLVLTLIALAGYFSLLYPLIERAPVSAPYWLHAIVLLPIAMGLPWVYRRIGQQVDHLWLGRRFTTTEAVKRFLSSMQRACGAGELRQRAEAGLREIFRAPARIRLGLEDVTDADGHPVVPIRTGDTHHGVIVMGPRDNQTPYFSQDRELLESLADVFGYMLENVSLQEREKEQQERTRELSLHASRSELKALRAQINPHFLFNALNAIAGLIHKDPQRADQTVEQLAEVFRYTLRGSEREWATLEDELEFARAYLEVEKSRFGERLSFDIAVTPDAAALTLPTMMLQTLVENGVKHGVCELCGPGRVEIRGEIVEGRLRVQVSDNGPGFEPSVLDEARDAKEDHGYGLHNVRRRLEGYFDGDARLSVDRLAGAERTVVTIELPARSRPSRPGTHSQGAA